MLMLENDHRCREVEWKATEHRAQGLQPSG
jgi:hypothetical protein